MKRKKLVNFLKTGIFLFVMSLFLWNCEKEDELIENITSNSNFIIKKIFTNTLQENKELNILLEKFTNKKTVVVARSRGLYNEKYGIVIDTESASYIEETNKHSYTFATVQGKDERIVNVLFSLNRQGGYDSFLVEYDYTFKELETLSKEELSSKTKMKPIDLELSSLQQRIKSSWICVYSYEYIKTGTTFTTGDSNLIVDEYSWVLVASSCHTAVTYDTDTGGYNSSSDTATYTTGGTIANYGDGAYTTTPTAPSTIYEGEDLYKLTVVKDELNLNIAEKQWADKNGETVFKIYDLLKENVFSSETKTFGNEVVSTKMQNPDAEIDFDDQIIDLLTVKAKCVYDKLTESSTYFKNAIKKFDGDFPVSHLKLEMRDLGNTRAVTEAPDGTGGNNSPDYVITIALNSNSNEHGVNHRPNLMNAKTIAHEIIHAEMYRKLLSVLDNGGNIAGVTRQNVLDALDGDFPGMYDYYRRHKNWQHQQMATHYRETIASILQVFDTGMPVPVDSNGKPIISQFYMDLSWEGLDKISIIGWQDGVSDDEKIRIRKVISDYIEANKNQNCN